MTKEEKVLKLMEELEINLSDVVSWHFDVQNIIQEYGLDWSTEYGTIDDNMKRALNVLTKGVMCIEKIRKLAKSKK